MCMCMHVYVCMYVCVCMCMYVQLYMVSSDDTTQFMPSLSSYRVLAYLFGANIKQNAHRMKILSLIFMVAWLLRGSKYTGQVHICVCTYVCVYVYVCMYACVCT